MKTFAAGRKETVKLELLPAARNGRPIIRIYAFSHDEIERLLAGVRALANGGIERLEIDQLSGVESLADCRLSLVRDENDLGVGAAGPSGSFTCRLTPDGWENVAGLIEPFSSATSGFQWLVDELDAADLLLSVTGEW